MGRSGGARLIALAASLLLVFSAAAPAEEPAPPPHLVASVLSRQLPLGRISLPRAPGPADTRLFFAAEDGRRLVAELEGTPHRRTVRLVAGNGSQLEVVRLPEFRPLTPGVVTVLAAQGERLVVVDPGPAGKGARLDLTPADPAVAAWVERRAPGILALVAEARDLAAALAARTAPGFPLPPGYAFSPRPLVGLGLLSGPPSGALLPEELTIEILSAGASKALLARFPEWRAPEPHPAPERRWEARVVGGRDEALGEVAASRDDDGIATGAVVRWNSGDRSEALRMSCDGEGLVRVTFERGDGKGPARVLALETLAGAPGDLGMQPWIVETLPGRRSPVTIPAEPEAEAARARQLFFEATEEAFWRAKLPPDEGARTLWRWYRILDSGRASDLLPELAGLVDLLATMHAPPFGDGPESAWAGAVAVE